MLDSTTRVLELAGARIGSIFGRLTDVELYRAILDRDFEFVIGLAEELAKQLYEMQVEYVAGGVGNN